MMNTIYPVLPDLISMAVVVVLPIVPAYLLFKLLPKTEGWVGGAFQGMEFKFSGAFAGYLMVLWVTYGYLPPSEFEVWTVTGQVELEGGAPADERVKISLAPDLRLIGDSLHFRITRPKNTGLFADPLPQIHLEAGPMYEADYIKLDSKRRDHYIKLGTIRLDLVPDKPNELADTEITQKQGGA